MPITVGAAFLQPTVPGGCVSVSGSVGAAVTAVRLGGTKLYGWYIFNSNSATVYCQIFNQPQVTLGTTVPYMSFGIPAGAAANILSSLGIGGFPVGLWVAFTTTRAGSAAPANTVDYNFFLI